MDLKVLSESLATPEALVRLSQILIEKEKLHRTLKDKDFGSRVINLEEARHSLSRVMQVTLQVLQLDNPPAATPELVLSERLSRLPRQIVVLYLLFLPPILFFLYLTLIQSEGGGALWLVRGAIVFLLFVPLLFYRRARINIEHECGYVRDSEGKAVIVIDQLPTVQFLSYLAHEYGHHLYFELVGTGEESWRREGVARLLQWQVMQQLYHQENKGAYLYHALVQVIGELKFACELIGRVIHQRVPRQVRSINTIYQKHPLLRLLTGTPGFSTTRLINHAVGTAIYFLEAHRLGSEQALRKSFERKKEENSKVPR